MQAPAREGAQVRGLKLERGPEQGPVMTVGPQPRCGVLGRWMKKGDSTRRSQATGGPGWRRVQLRQHPQRLCPWPYPAGRVQP